MRFISIYRPSAACVGKPPTQETYELMGKFMAEAVKAGVLLATEGFGPQTDTDLKVKLANGTYSTTDGPFTEAKEVIGGFTILNLASKQEALEEVRKFMELHRIHWPSWEGQVEIRLMYEQEDDVRATQIEGSRLLEHAGGARGHEAR